MPEEPTSSASSSNFHLARHQTHLKWDNSLPPIQTITSGSEITFDLLDGGNNQFDATATTASLGTFDFSIADPAHGPIHISGASPGDVLKIEILSLETASYGWTAIFPGSVGFGLLADEFPDACLKLWDLETHRTEGFTEFKKGIHIPTRPFLGVVGVAREQKGEWSTIPPYETGGNIDCRDASTVGSVLYLPVKVEGALLSIGDGHAAQGDGEVCGTAIETPMKGRMRISVIKGMEMPYVDTPSFITAPKGKMERNGMKEGEGREFTVLGIDADLREASRKAIRGVIAWLVSEKGLLREEAYMLCSVAAGLRIAEAVDMPHYAVSCCLPLGIFVDEN
ncbi:hypothetical protein G7Y89_g14842 [Cudoniella acicularis]|uniref:Formamidase n=1 Tax=Cudoniella acicularis TaxID=354080 RepID=A0A8H4VT36_9HELO|nr:hypothetical protein G7Y89_g14842 [Cudoniella acicularis]